ncbi:hypothetical protein RhiirA4_471368 [Rhizophagus irregularis]|uniref:Uncharacterized protein n=1 Tax=Rhizophagus irregularis TaxID=588596 RepID=A0A2I1H300_9GLOM|nr:hypothetical protein RhiirA4_471368 [Rhizophagus irregularis]
MSNLKIKLEEIEEIDKASCELNEIKINFIHDQSVKKTIQENDKIFQMALPSISVANVTLENPAKCGDYAFALLGSKIHLIQILAMYYKLSNYHSYIDNTSSIDSLSYISACVYTEQIPRNCKNFTENMGFLIVGKKEIIATNKMKVSANFEIWFNLVRIGQLADYKKGLTICKKRKKFMKEVKLDIVKAYFSGVDENLKDFIADDDKM